MERFWGKRPKRNKYGAKKVEVDGIRFHSKKEADYYCRLKLLKRAGEVDFFLRQVPFDLPGGVKYRCDFQVFWSDGKVTFVDVKGFMTKTSKLKIKQVEELYPIEIVLV